VGVYFASRQQLPDVAVEGFDLVAAPADLAYLGQAHDYGVHVIAQSTVVTHSDEPHLAALKRMEREPALFAWYLIDEPDLHGISPSEVRARNREFKARARKPTFTVVSSGAAVEKYINCSDYLGVDYYPIPWAPVSTFGREMRLARIGAGSKGFFAILQAFDWSAVPELIRTDKPLREPTYAELRCMAYMALANSARGLLFYSYSEPRWQLKAHPELWTAVEQLAVEIRQDAPIFQHRIPWFPVETNHHGADPFNDIFEARVMLNLFEVKKKTNDIEPGFYLSCINTEPEPLDYSFKIPFESRSDNIALVHSNETLTIENGWINKHLAGFEAAVFGPIQPLQKPRWLE
jgi:hypothetical protein